MASIDQVKLTLESTTQLPELALQTRKTSNDLFKTFTDVPMTPTTQTGI
jgi:hypothetical protein